MPLKIGTEIVSKLKIGTEIVGGMKLGTEVIYRSVVTPVDTPGTYTVTGSRISGRNPYQTISVLTDTDGIRAVSSAIFTASDGTTSDRTSSFARTDTNTFSATLRLRNARWQAGSVAITYTDGNGVTSTLTDTWSIR